VGALSRLVLAFGQQLPLAQMVPFIVDALPLQADAGENAPAVRALMALARDEGTRGLLGPYMAQLLSIFGKLLGPCRLEEKGLLAELGAFVVWLHGLAPEQLQAGVMALPEAERAPLQELLQGGQLV